MAKKRKQRPLVPEADLTEALVVRSVGSSHRVQTDRGEKFDCLVRGKFRIAGLQTTNPVAVGDRVRCTLPTEDSQGVIRELLPRKNYLLRKAIAHATKVHILATNLDQALLLFTLKEPRTSTGFADRFLTVCEAFDIPARIILNKIDLIDTPEEAAALAVVRRGYEQAGYPVHELSALDPDQREQVRQLLQDKTTFIGGHSGAGKSTLVNLVDPNLDLKTGDISESSGKGTHTTTYAEMHFLAVGGAIIDSPGIKEWGLADLEARELSHFFPEMRAGMHDCKFSDCLHRQEPRCAVRAAVEAGDIADFRYQNYLRFLEELEAEKPY